MSFYGNITNFTRSQFQFDKIYPNKKELMDNAQYDGVYIGRYVLIEYDKSSGLTGSRPYYFIKNNILYTDSQYVHEFIPKEGEIYAVYHDNKLTFYKKKSKDTNNKEVVLVEVKEDDYTNNYNTDLDAYGSACGRGFDSTVWMKTYIYSVAQGKRIETYVKIADLNTITPAFGMTVMAPTTAPIAPYFDDNSTNVYYNLRYQVPWGFRVRPSNNGVFKYVKKMGAEEIWSGSYDSITGVPTGGTTISNSSVGSNFPSDSKIKLKMYNNATHNEVPYYINPYGNFTYESKVNNVSNSLDVDGAIYFNKAGMDKDVIHKSDDIAEVFKNNSLISDGVAHLKDVITLTPTGYSGRTYIDKDKSCLSEPQLEVDTQELVINLPSVGDAISDFWDIMYGDSVLNRSIGNYEKDSSGNIVYRNYKGEIWVPKKDNNDELIDPETQGYKPTLFRNPKMGWQYADNVDRSGFRLTGQSGKEYNPDQMNTVVGSINTLHDLIGMIIVNGDSVEPENARYDRIYYMPGVGDEGRYAIRGTDYIYTPLTDEQKDILLTQGINPGTEKIVVTENYYAGDGTLLYAKGEALPIEFIKYLIDNKDNGITQQEGYSDIFTIREDATIASVNLQNFPIGFKTEVPAWKYLDEYATDEDTVNGLILKMYRMIRGENDETRDYNNSLTGALNKLDDILNKIRGDIRPDEILYIDKVGRVSSTNLKGFESLYLGDGILSHVSEENPYHFDEKLIDWKLMADVTPVNEEINCGDTYLQALWKLDYRTRIMRTRQRDVSWEPGFILQGVPYSL